MQSPPSDSAAGALKASDAAAARRVTWAGMGANAALAVGKVTVGLVFHSRAILADGLHSGSDLVTDLAVLASLRVSEKPADGCHRYGHRRVSTLTGMFIGAMLLLAAAYIIYDAVASHAAHDGRSVDHVRGVWPLVMALVSIPLKELLYQVTRYVGRRTGNVALLANAWHHRTDAMTSVAAAVGLTAVTFGGPQWEFMDHITAVVLGAFLVVVAARIMVRAGGELVDRAPSAATLSGIEQALARTDGVRSYHAFRARRVGGKMEMDVHVQVDGDLTVAEGHEIATRVKYRVKAADPTVIEVIVHIEPVED